jgi:hypothetical protein
VVYEETEGYWTSKLLAYDAGLDLWIGTVTSDLTEFNYFVQAVDGAGNVSTSGNKGLYFIAEPEKLYLPLILNGSSP